MSPSEPFFERADSLGPVFPPGTAESPTEFLARREPPARWVVPDLLPAKSIMLAHGQPRARKSFYALELALAVATGTAPFGLARFRPEAPASVVYVQEEDGRDLTQDRLEPLLRARGPAPDATLSLIVRKGLSLDEAAHVGWLADHVRERQAVLLVLDAARRLSAYTDEGPAKVRALTSVLRHLVATTGASLLLVHHDVKPPHQGSDQRARSQRASGGDWFAAAECPVHLERVSSTTSLVFPEDYKGSADPAPFTYALTLQHGRVTALTGTDTSPAEAERAGVKGKVLDWLRANGPATKTAMKRAGLGRWETIEGALDSLLKEGRIDVTAGSRRGSQLFFVPSPPLGTQDPVSDNGHP